MRGEKIPDEGRPSRTLKQAILGTGLPLQASVRRVFGKLEILDKGSLYVRRPGGGADEEADCWGIARHRMGKELLLRHQIIAECKYGEGTWLFYDAPENVNDGSVNLAIQQFLLPYTPLSSVWYSPGPVLSPGVALHRSGKGTAPWQTDMMKIPGALRQAWIPAGQVYANSIVDQVVRDAGLALELIHPIVVTTATLVRVKPGTAMADVEEAPEDMGLGDDGAPSENSLLSGLKWANVAVTPPPYAAQTYEEMLNARFDALSPRLLEEALEKPRLQRLGGNLRSRRIAIVARQLELVPSRAYIVNIDHLEEFLKGLLSAANAHVEGQVKLTAPTLLSVSDIAKPSAHATRHGA